MSEDYESSGSYYADDAKPEGGSIKKGILVGILVTLAFELFVSFVLDAQGNLVHRYIAYMLGIVALFVAAFYSKSIWKMFFLGTPVIVIVSFILPLASPDNFAGLMSPFINLLPTINGISDSLQNISGQDSESLEDYVDLLNTYGIILDFVLAIIVGTFAALGLVGFVKIFSNKPGILTIISFIFSLIFFIVGVILLPYILVVATGTSQFVLAVGAGGLNLAEGLKTIEDGGTTAEANVFFEEAEKWFDEADQMLQGLEQLQVFNLLGTAGPDYKVLVDNFLILIDSAVSMAKTVGPLFVGISALEEGFDKSLGVLTTGLAVTQLQLSELSPADQQEFDDGLVLVKQGFGNFSDAIPEIQNALTKFEKINREETLDAAASQGVESDVEEQLNLIQGTVNLINAALDILNVLISPSELPPPSPGFTVEEPLIHLLRGALSLTGASSSVGDNSDFSGTGPTFQSIINHLTVVVDTFDDDAFNTFENDTDVLEVEELVDMKDQLQGMFNFIQDSGNIAISMGAFGLVASPTLISMNETLQVFKEKEFTDITPTEYKDRIDDFDLPGGIIENATRMMNDGEAVDNQVLAMEVRSNNDEYGLLSTAAEDFVSVFKDFDMATNGKNFFHLSHAFSNILKTGRDMTVVDSEVAKIQLESAFLSTVDYINNASAIDDSILRIEASLTIINE
ncbi:MAG: hypothetical protein ACXAC2_05680, partial [Candidatus Kariarchaeaceae archaeon]